MTDPGGMLAARSGASTWRRSISAWRWVPALVLASALVFLVAVPLLTLLQAAVENGLAGLVEAVTSAAPSVGASLWTSLGATILAVGLGATLAVLTERTDVPARRGLRLAMLVAFIVPGYVSAIGWLNAYGPGGVLDDIFGLSAPALVGPLGVIVVLGVESAPLAYLVVSAGLASRAEPDMERAARASGATALTAFRTVTLPLLRPVLAGAAAIAFVFSVTSFGIPAVLGIPAGFTTMTTRIYRDLAFSADSASFVEAVGLALVLAVGTAILIAGADALLDRRPGQRSGAFGGPAGSNNRAVSGRAAEGTGVTRTWLRPRALVLGVAAWAVAGLVIVLPLVALLLTALTRAPGLDPVPANWTLRNFGEVVDQHTLRALGNSAVLAAGAAAGVVLLAGAGVAARRGHGRGPLGSLLGLTFALPGSTLAVAVLLAYGVALRDTLLIILVAYLAKFWALGYRPIAAGLDGLAPDVYHAARVSGADGLTTTRTIVVPLLRPMIVAGALIVFMFGLHEVTMSSLLYGPGTATLAVVVLNLQQLGEAGATAALAVLLTGLAALAGLPLLGRTGALHRAGTGR